MNKKLIAPIFTAAALLAVSVGSTFALFTSDDETNIAITAGKVQVKASVEDIKLFSAWPSNLSIEGLNLEKVGDTDELLTQSDEFGNLYYSKIMDAGFFETNGTVVYNSGVLSLDKVAPGDKTEFTVKFENSSNIDVKYRIGVECLSEDNEELRFFSNLEFNINSENLTNLKKYVSEWKLLSPGNEIDDQDVSIKLPLIAGNDLQEHGCDIRIFVEAVQANAFVNNDGTKLFLDFSSQKVEENEDKETGLDDLTLRAGQAPEEAGENKPLVEVKVPASTDAVLAYTEGGEGVQITSEDTLTLKVEEKENSGNISLQLDEKSLDYEISLYNQEGKKIKSTSEFMNVDVYVGKGLRITRVYHKGVEIEPTDYTYDSNEGYVHIHAKDFSPFNVMYKVCLHDFGEMEVIIAPTLTTEGVGRYTCKDCLYTYEVVIDKHVHSYKEISRAKGRSCIEGEEVTYECSCGDKKVEHVDHEIIGSYCNTCHQPVSFVMTNQDVAQLMPFIASLGGNLNTECDAWRYVEALTGNTLFGSQEKVVDLTDGNIRVNTDFNGNYIKLDATYYFSPYSFERMLGQIAGTYTDSLISYVKKYVEIDTPNGKEYRLPEQGEQFNEYDLCSEYDMVAQFYDGSYYASYTINFDKEINFGDATIGGYRANFNNPNVTGLSFAIELENLIDGKINGEQIIYKNQSYSSLINEVPIFACGIKNNNLTEGTTCSVNLYLHDSQLSSEDCQYTLDNKYIVSHIDHII